MGTKWKKWAKEEEEKLIEIYSDMRNIDIAKLLNIEEDQVKRKAFSLKLKKSKEQKSKNIASRNKMYGRDLSYENLKKIALKYKTRGEFQRLDGSAYTTARILGYLNDICSHMVAGTYSIPQLILFCIVSKLFDNVKYNCRNIIKPYELDVYVKKYKLAFEYDGKGWHANKELDAIKTDLCKKKNIILIRLIENNRKYESDIKQQLIENLKIINNRCNKNFNENDIINITSDYINNFVNDQIIDEKEIINIVSKYDNYHDFKITEVSLYQKLIKRRLIEKYTSGLKRDIIFWTEEKAIKEINKYETLGDFIKKSNKCYNYIKKNNLSYLLDNLTKKYETYDIDKLKLEIEKYEYLKDFKRKSKKYFYYIKQHKLSYLIKDLKRSTKPRIFTIDDIENEIRKYEYLVDFRKNCSKHYRFVKKHNLYDLISQLKRNKPVFSEEEIKNEINKYKSLKDFRENSNSHYRFILKKKLNHLLKELK